jgi:hypothetical protein
MTALHGMEGAKNTMSNGIRLRLLAAGIFASAALTVWGQDRGSPIQPSPVGEPMPVSIVALLATPEGLNHKAVQAIGFLVIEFEGSRLCLHREDYEYGLPNCVSLDLSELQMEQFWGLNLKHVLLQGTVVAQRDRFGGVSVTIEQVSRLETWAELPREAPRCPHITCDKPPPKKR